MNKKILIYVLIFWLSALALFVAYQEFTKVTGEEVEFEITRVSQDNFPQRQLTLTYNITMVSTNKSVSNVEFGADVYVKLNTSGRYATAASIHRQKPDGLSIRGEVMRFPGDEFRIRYGIERYFISQDSGSIWATNRSAIIAIDRFGRAAIKEVRIGDEVLA